LVHSLRELQRGDEQALFVAEIVGDKRHIDAGLRGYASHCGCAKAHGRELLAARGKNLVSIRSLATDRTDGAANFALHEETLPAICDQFNTR
jgi:hypothetical protein